MAPEDLTSLITCVIPAFNAARYLDETLASVRAQTLGPPAIVVVDDGSTDATPDIAAAHGGAVLLVRQENRGRADACNRGLREAVTDLVAFVDADDLWAPDKLERQVARFRARPELDYCVAGIRNFVSPELHGDVERAILGDQVGFALSTLLARRRLFERIGGFDTARRHTHDTDWFVRARAAGAVVEVIPDVLVQRRLHPDSVTQRHGARSRSEYLRLLKSMLDERRARA